MEKTMQASRMGYMGTTAFPSELKASLRFWVLGFKVEILQVTNAIKNHSGYGSCLVAFVVAKP